MRKRKSGRQALTGVIIAAAAVIVLLIAGTALRMKSMNMAFADAFSSFIRDTFCAGNR